MTERRRLRSIEACVFGAAFLAFAYFHQGGNWLQNATFAQVRAVVEQGRFPVDSFLAYLSVDTVEGGYRLVRTEMTGAKFERRGTLNRVTWPGGEESVDPSVTEGRILPLPLVACSAELVYAAPHFYPRQAPGLAVLALPAYFLVYHVERLAGFDADEWWVFTVNGWLTTALSVGLISALGAVLFFRTALTLWPERLAEALAATFTFAFATIFFPDATMLRAENVVAVALLLAFYLVVRAERRGGDSALAGHVAAGLSLGIAVACSYSALAPALVIAVFSARRSRWMGVAAMACGLLVPLGAVAIYHGVAFGSPLRTAYSVPYMMDHDGGSFWTFVQFPHPLRMAAMLVSPFRGLFFTMPVLLATLPGLWFMTRNRALRSVSVSAVAILLATLVLACTRREWHGSWTFGPRLLVPAIPFLCLGLVDAFRRAWRLTTGLAVFSAAVMFVVTAVDAQPTIGVAGIAEREARPTLLREPFSEYILPTFTLGLATGLLETQVEQEMAKIETQLEAENLAPEELAERLAAARRRYARTIQRGDNQLGLASFRGPVSSNPIGMFEPWPMHLFSWQEPEQRWHAFNAGELLFPQRRLSLLFLLIAGGWLVLVGLGLARTRDSSDPA